MTCTCTCMHMSCACACSMCSTMTCFDSRFHFATTSPAHGEAAGKRSHVLAAGERAQKKIPSPLQRATHARSSAPCECRKRHSLCSALPATLAHTAKPRPRAPCTAGRSSARGPSPRRSTGTLLARARASRALPTPRGAAARGSRARAPRGRPRRAAQRPARSTNRPSARRATAPRATRRSAPRARRATRVARHSSCAKRLRSRASSRTRRCSSDLN